MLASARLQIYTAQQKRSHLSVDDVSLLDKSVCYSKLDLA